MKAFVVSDIHGNKGIIEKIKEKKEEHSPELLLILGDFSFDSLEFPTFFLEKTVDLFERVLAIPGNVDSPKILDLLEEFGVNLHLKEKEYGGYRFVGVGGAPKGIFSTPFVWNESFMKAWLEEISFKDAIVLLHSPPYGILDLAFNEINIGSRALREKLDKEKPLVVFSGHVHEAKGFVKEPFLAINPGPAKEGNLLLFDFSDFSFSWV